MSCGQPASGPPHTPSTSPLLPAAPSLAPDYRSVLAQVQHACCKQAINCSFVGYSALPDSCSWNSTTLVCALARNLPCHAVPAAAFHGDRDLHHGALKGLCPNVSQASRLYRAFGLLQEMRTAGQAPDVITYHTLLRLCDQAGQGHSASTLYQVRDGDCALCDDRTACARAQPDAQPFAKLVVHVRCCQRQAYSCHCMVKRLPLRY